MINKRFIVAVVQMDSQADKQANMNCACEFIDEAVNMGASLVSFPELMNYIGDKIIEGDIPETIPGYTTNILIEKAKKYNIYIHCGSIYELINQNNRYFNTTIMINPKGEIIAKYRKIHMFDVTLPDGTVCHESSTCYAGDQIVTVDSEIGKLGFSICYDIRFPELFRIMALDGAQIIFTPSNFTMQTGKDHWESILRTRAIDNGVYIIAAGQIGKKINYTAYGNSMVVDPWGTVIARAKNNPGVTIAEIDLGYIDEVRAKISSLKNRRTDIYTLDIK